MTRTRSYPDAPSILSRFGPHVPRWTLPATGAYHARVALPDAADSRHVHCWYSRRSARMPAELGFHTIEDGLLVYCAHPMMFPVVGYHFDIRNCDGCEYYRAAMLPKQQQRR